VLVGVATTENSSFTVSSLWSEVVVKVERTFTGLGCGYIAHRSKPGMPSPVPLLSLRSRLTAGQARFEMAVSRSIRSEANLTNRRDIPESCRCGRRERWG
jgi:hypothetical protein